MGIFHLGVFIKNKYTVKRVGRSDTEVKQLLKDFLNKGYTHFHVTLFNNPVSAYINECTLYHYYEDAGHKLDNEIHPERPRDSPATLKCHICGK